MNDGFAQRETCEVEVRKERPGDKHVNGVVFVRDEEALPQMTRGG